MLSINTSRSGTNIPSKSNLLQKFEIEFYNSLNLYAP